MYRQRLELSYYFSGYFRAAEESASVKKITHENGKNGGYMKFA